VNLALQTGNHQHPICPVSPTRLRYVSMYIHSLTSLLARILLPVAFCLTTYLYFYPIFHSCIFPSKDGSIVTAFRRALNQHAGSVWNQTSSAEPSIPPFRLLTLADPQLEGDSSLPDPENGFFPKLERHWSRLKSSAGVDLSGTLIQVLPELALEDIPDALQALRKRLDLFGNDYFLGHVFRTLHWWTKPTHVAVLGDLVGSQWVTDEEFESRGWRYWNRVLAGGKRVDESITNWGAKEESKERLVRMDDAKWTDTIINIAGNHDIGYAGDVSRKRIERFEKVFGKANWDVTFEYPPGGSNEANRSGAAPTLHLIVLNSLLLDTPALCEDLQAETYDYLNDLIGRRLRPVEDRTSFTLLLTHLPLHKPEGVCVDAPFFDFWGDDDGCGVYRPHGLKEQNHLSLHASRGGTLEALFGMTGNLDAPAQGKGRNGLILTGHDHEGCDVWHYIPANSTSSFGQDEKETEWDAVRWRHADLNRAHTGIREVTLRSMMGDYGGNAGLLSAWFDFEDGEWRYDITMCTLNLTLWWAVHVVDLLALGCLVVRLLSSQPYRPNGRPVKEGQSQMASSKARDSGSL